MEIDAGQDQMKAKVFSSQRNDLEEGNGGSWKSHVNVRVSIQLKYFLGGNPLLFQQAFVILTHLVYLHK